MKRKLKDSTIINPTSSSPKASNQTLVLTLLRCLRRETGCLEYWLTSEHVRIKTCKGPLHSHSWARFTWCCALEHSCYFDTRGQHYQLHIQYLGKKESYHINIRFCILDLAETEIQNRSWVSGTQALIVLGEIVYCTCDRLLRHHVSIRPRVPE